MTNTTIDYTFIMQLWEAFNFWWNVLYGFQTINNTFSQTFKFDSLSINPLIHISSKFWGSRLTRVCFSCTQFSVALSIFLLRFYFLSVLPLLFPSFPFSVWTHSSFCSSFTSWVFWSGVMRANTVVRNKTCNDSMSGNKPCWQTIDHDLDVTDSLQSPSLLFKGKWRLKDW